MKEKGNNNREQITDGAVCKSVCIRAMKQYKALN